MRQYFRAPWSLKLKLSTGVFSLVLLIVALQAGAFGALGLLAIVVIAALYSVRGYSIEEGRLTIHRPGWVISYDLSRLVDAKVLAEGPQGSLRMFGIGGLFGFVGWFWHSDLGWYQAYATDSSRAVILDFGNKKVLVTPESPPEFAAAARLNRFFETSGG